MEGLGCRWKGEGADGRVRVQMEGCEMEGLADGRVRVQMEGLGCRWKG